MKSKLLMCMCSAAVVFASISFASGAADVYTGDKSVIDTKNAENGYITAKYTAGENRKIKVIVDKDGGSYTYDLNSKAQAESYPLQMGNGTYKVRVLQNTSGTKYVALQTVTFDVTLSNQFAPYLVSTQFVNYNSNSTAVKTAENLTGKMTDTTQKVDAIYGYVTDLLKYDNNRAATVQSGYVPNINSVVSEKKGICFDYAAVMASMLRSQNIPTKLVMGYVSPNGLYHAWNEVYIEGKGWIKTGEMTFNGKSWSLMDSTFLSGNKTNKTMVSFVKNQANYAVKNVY